mmetsp:Transcript_13115/g.9170  ORF Transcript_13115/g.9170 Transcript_13115/m.9170 type:complete len:105 (-) Transcript_13115:1691-2005(-)
MEIYIAAEKSIKVWNAIEGKPVRNLKNIFDNDITCIELDHEHRKIIVGSHSGQIKIFDIQSGMMVNQLEGHDKDGGEISFLGYGGSDNTIISCAWDKVIKIHRD